MPRNTPHSEETKRKIKEKLKGRHFGYKFLKGHKLSKESIKKAADAKRGKPQPWDHSHPGHKGRKGAFLDKNYFWDGGKSFEKYTLNWTETLKRSIRERDNYICQICSQYGNEVHHKDFDKKNCDPKNLITLCKRCHSWVTAKKIEL